MKYVYFIRAADGTGPIKIGATGNLMRRLYALSLERNQPLVFLAFAEGTHDDENRIQRGFFQYRVDGEWFEPVEPLLEFVRQVIRSGELPAPPSDKRVADMADMYVNGATLREIGEKYGLTRERVRQILRRDNIDSLGWRPETMGSNAIPHDVRRAIADDYAANPSLKMVAEKHGVSPTCVRKIAVELGVPLRGKGRAAITYERAQKAALLYHNGYKTQQIADEIGCRYQSTVFRYLAIAGVNASRRGKRAAEVQAA